MYVNPNSDVYLLQNVRLTPTLEHTIYFPTLAAQTAYFTGKKAFEFKKLSYIVPENGVLNVKAVADTLYNCPYLMFKNSAFGSKWFYAFVNSVDYLANGTAEIRFTIDPIQTWYFDVRHGAGFIERQHSLTDAVGDNRVPENLDFGEYQLISAWQPADGIAPNIYLATTADVNSDGSVVNVSGGYIGGVYSGVDVKSFPNTNDGIANLNNFLTKLTDAGKADAVVSVYLAPQNYYNSSSPADSVNTQIEIARKTVLIGGNLPKNRKLQTDPYNVLLATDGTGATKTFNYDDFSAKTQLKAQFTFRASVAPPAGASLIPYNYKGTGLNGWNRDESFSTTNSAQVAINVDTFRAWLAQNGQGVPMLVDTLAGLASIGGGLALGGVSAAVAPTAAASAIAATTTAINGAVGASGWVSSTIGKMSDFSARSKAAPKTVGSFSPSLQYTSASAGLRVYYATLRDDVAKIIDDYFTRFGYAINRVATPTLNARENFTYIKMQSPCITGNCPQDVLTAYHNAFTQGITYWMDGDKIGDYSVSNRPWNEVNT